MIGNRAKLLVDIWQSQAQWGEQPGSYDSNCLCCSAEVSWGEAELLLWVHFIHSSTPGCGLSPWDAPPGCSISPGGGMTRGTPPSPSAELGCFMMLRHHHECHPKKNLTAVTQSRDGRTETAAQMGCICTGLGRLPAQVSGNRCSIPTRVAPLVKALLELYPPPQAFFFSPRKVVALSWLCAMTKGLLKVSCHLSELKQRLCICSEIILRAASTAQHWLLPCKSQPQPRGLPTLNQLHVPQHSQPCLGAAPGH